MQKDGDPTGGSFIPQGHGGWSLLSGWSTGSIQEGRAANPDGNFSANRMRSLVMSNEVTVSAFTTP